MTHVTRFYNTFEQRLWHRLETFSQSHPKTAKAVFPPAFLIGHAVKEIFKNPLIAVEHLVGIGIDSIQYCKETDSKKAWWINNSIQSHIFNLFASIFRSLVLPPFILINAIGLAVTSYNSPAKTVKIQASKQDLKAFLEEEQIHPSKGYSEGKLDTIASRHKYAKHALKHFCKKVREASDTEAAKLHFCDTLESRNLLVKELNAKDEHYSKYWKTYLDHIPMNEPALRETYRLKWLNYQKELLNADMAALDSVSFVPETPSHNIDWSFLDKEDWNQFNSSPIN